MFRLRHLVFAVFICSRFDSLLASAISFSVTPGFSFSAHFSTSRLGSASTSRLVSASTSRLTSLFAVHSPRLHWFLASASLFVSAPLFVRFGIVFCIVLVSNSRLQLAQLLQQYRTFTSVFRVSSPTARAHFGIVFSLIQLSSHHHHLVTASASSSACFDCDRFFVGPHLVLTSISSTRSYSLCSLRPRVHLRSTATSLPLCFS